VCFTLMLVYLSTTPFRLLKLMSSDADVCVSILSLCPRLRRLWHRRQAYGYFPAYRHASYCLVGQNHRIISTNYASHQILQHSQPYNTAPTRIRKAWHMQTIHIPRHHQPPPIEDIAQPETGELKTQSWSSSSLIVCIQRNQSKGKFVFY
jgi:hypothetical protein